MWRDELRARGYIKARRGQQFCGGGESPDVICEELAYFHFEVKFVESLNVRKAMQQSEDECGEKIPILAHKTSNAKWLVTMLASDWLELIDNMDAPSETGAAIC